MPFWGAVAMVLAALALAQGASGAPKKGKQKQAAARLTLTSSSLVVPRFSAARLEDAPVADLQYALFLAEVRKRPDHALVHWSTSKRG